LFRGLYTYSVDAKGRVSIPARLRKHFNPDAKDTVVMTQGTSKCINVYPFDQWQVIENRLLKLNPFIPEHARFIRTISQYATEDVLDSQSRILIPQSLLTYAGIEKEVVILGVLEKIELWNPDTYKEYMEASDEPYEQFAAKVMANER
jgi:MraZ protein